RHFHHDQRVTPPTQRPAARSGLRARFQNFVDVRARRLENRKQTEEQRSQHGHRQREDERPRIDLNFVQSRHLLRAVPLDCAKSPQRHQQARAAGEQSEQQTLGQQVARYPPDSRAQRDAQGQFLPPGARPHEQEVRDVRASDQQKKTHRSQQHPQSAAHLRSYNLFIHGRQVSGDVSVMLWILQLQTRGDVGQLRLRLRKCHALPQAANRLQNLRAALVQVSSLRCDGGYEFGLLRGQRQLEAGRQNADDGERLSIQCKLPSQRRIGAAQSVLPKLMADDDHSFGAALLFLDLKIAASDRFDLDEREEIGGHAQALQAFSLLVIEENEPVGLVTSDRLEASVLRATILQIEIRNVTFAAFVFGGSPDLGHAP